jgi:hypothetical protein
VDRYVRKLGESVKKFGSVSETPGDATRKQGSLAF